MSDTSSANKDLAAKVDKLQARVAELEGALKKSAASGSSSENSLALIVEAFELSPASFIITRLDDSTIVDLNQAACEITGYSKETARGKRIQDLDAWVVAEDRAQFLAELASKKMVDRFETLFRSHSGVVGPYLISARLISVEGVDYVVSTGSDLAPRGQQETDLDESLQTSSDILEYSPAGFIIYEYEAPNSLRLVAANPEAQRSTGIDPEQDTGREFDDLWPAARSSGLTDDLLEVMRSGRSYQNEEFTYDDPELSGIYRVVAFRLPGDRLAVAFDDVTKLKEGESERDLTIQFLQLVHTDNELQDLIGSITDLLQHWSGCEAIGIRLQDGEDFPYVQTKGFVQSTPKAGSGLCRRNENDEIGRDAGGLPLLECMCGIVLRQTTDSSLPFFSAKGSFWTNSTSELLRSDFVHDELKNVCHRCYEGAYESVALVPLRNPKGVMGLLQFSDTRPGCFTPHRIALFERLADSLASGLAYRQAIEAIEISEERYRTLFETAQEGIYISKGDVVIDCNPAACAMVGVSSKEEVIGRNIANLSPQSQEDGADSKAKSNQLIELALEGSPQRFSWQGFGHDGELTYFDVSLVGVGPRAQGLTLAVVRDISEQVRAEQALRTNELRLKEAEGLVRMGGWEFDRITGKVAWTDMLFEVMELDRNEPLSPKEMGDHCIEGDRERLEQAYQSATETGEPFNTEIQCKTAKGRQFWARVIGKPEFVDGECVKLKGIFQDISERKEWEVVQEDLKAQLHHSQKMEAVGQLAGGIAHDFNNILTAILGNVELLHLGLDSIVDPADPVLDWLNQVTDAAQRAADLTRQLLAFSRKQLLNPRVLDPVALVYGVEDMLRRVIREDIALEISCEPNILHVRADAGQIEQVLLNLVVNARDALPQGGKIKINVQNVNIGSRYAQQIAELKSGEYVAICVEDNGKGIPKDVVEQVFEPFFTTKSSGEGTGLGLAMVHGIVKQSCGHVRVESREGQGALFEVYLPAIREEIVGEQKAEILLGELRGDETVLVCEDDDAIRSLAVHALKSKGYVVLEASNANDALRIDRELDKPIDALVTDVIMPGMNGKDLADSLVNRHPQLRVLFVSGYTADVIGEHGVMQEGMEFLEKPYTSRNLVQRLRAILDKE